MISIKWLGLAALIGSLAATLPTFAQDQRSPALPKITHVFIITLENEGFDETFGPKSEAPYLSKTLTAKGALLNQYFGTTHASLGNYLAMISGQAATNETRGDCFTFSDFKRTGMTPDGQAIGTGCVYPADIQTLADQLTAAGKTWRGYMEDMGNDQARENQTCGHPPLNSKDETHKAEIGDQYASRHDPFVYFHSLIDSGACASNVVPLEPLARDLVTETTTPNFLFITPNLCNDGHDEPCISGEHGGLETADKFLQKWVPMILASPAYKNGGLLIINFDEGDFADVSPGPNGTTTKTYAGEFCCNQQPGPNLGAFPQSMTFGKTTYVAKNYGGDRTGAVLLSPYIKAGTVAKTPFNHYALLKSIEDIFGFDHLGYAGQQGLVGFFDCGSDVAIAKPQCDKK
jgi:phosphatidylinositol-3-phosphatase